MPDKTIEYRDLALRCRNVARAVVNPKVKQTLAEIAEEYERKVAELERSRPRRES